MAFGVTNAATDQTGRTTSYSVDAAEKKNKDNKTVEFTTHNPQQEVTETFVANSENVTNQAVAGQVSSDQVVVKHDVVEKYDGYADVAITSKVITPAVTTTTTTGA